MLQRRNSSPLGIPLLVCLAGLSFATWVAFADSQETCISTGCQLFSDLSYAGVSLWHVGMFAFATLSLAALLGRTGLGLALAGLFLLGDIALLALMAFIAPCANCLIIATLFAFSYAAFRAAKASPREPLGFPWLLFIWALLCSSNLVSLAEERLSPWILQGTPEASVRIYFSPSCPACRDAIMGLLPSAKDVAFIPVAENDDDLNAIAVMQGQIAEGSSFFLAYRRATEATPRPVALLSATQEASLRFKLLRNKAHVFAAGSNRLPLIQTHGLAKLPGIGSNAPAADATLPLQPLEFEGCSGQPSAAPCPDATAR